MRCDEQQLDLGYFFEIDVVVAVDFVTEVTDEETPSCTIVMEVMRKSENSPNPTLVMSCCCCRDEPCFASRNVAFGEWLCANLCEFPQNESNFLKSNSLLLSPVSIRTTEMGKLLNTCLESSLSRELSVIVIHRVIIARRASTKNFDSFE